MIIQSGDLKLIEKINDALKAEKEGLEYGLTSLFERYEIPLDSVLTLKNSKGEKISIKIQELTESLFYSLTNDYSQEIATKLLAK